MKPSRTLALLVPALALVLAPFEAPAAGGDPVNPLDTAEGAIPIGRSLPPSPAGLTATDRPQRLGSKILYVNFDGQDMNGCNNNNPVNNCSTIFSGVVLPYSGDAVKRASIVQVIRKRVADFGITITDQRPDSGDYDMEMVGNWQGSTPGFAGVAPNIDCYDATGGETSFTLEASNSSDGIAEIVLQELAHTWGLEHVNVQQDLLYPTTQGTNKTFRNECAKIVGDTDLNPTNGYCNPVHTQFCSFGWQNSYEELLYLFGESIPDTTPPGVTIVSPADGATLEGGTFDLVIGFEDDQSPAVITTDIRLEGGDLPEPVEAGGAYAAPGELAFPIQDLPDGSYSVRVDVQDESDNPAFDEITFTIVGNPPAAGDDGADGSGSGGAGSDDAGSDGAGSDGGSGDAGDTTGADDAGLVDPQQPVENGGCDCRTDRPRSAPLAALLGFVVLFGRRRRRSATC